jgi:FdrA protein
VAVVSGTDEDPQDMNSQIKQLKEVGVRVEISNDVAVRYVGRLIRSLDPTFSSARDNTFTSVDLSVLKQPLAAINVGLESFTQSLKAQNTQVIHVDWRPAAGGNEKLMAILERMRS